MKTVRLTYKPTFVEAIQVTPRNMNEVARWCGGKIQEGFRTPKSEPAICIKVDVVRAATERQTQAFFGDWLLKLETGFKVYTNKAKLQMFDEVNNNTSASGDPAMRLLEDVFMGAESE